MIPLGMLLPNVGEQVESAALPDVALQTIGDRAADRLILFIFQLLISSSLTRSLVWAALAPTLSRGRRHLIFFGGLVGRRGCSGRDGGRRIGHL